MKKLRNKIFLWFVSLLPPCHVITHQLSESIDNKLTLSERFKIKLHLKTCIWCTRYGQQIDFVDTAMREMFKKAEIELRDASLSTESKKRMKQLLEDASTDLT